MPWRKRFAKWKDRTARMTPVADALSAAIGNMDGGIRLRLVELWKAWPELMGPLAELARPLSHRNRTLVIGAADSIVMQELSFFQLEILDKVNGFLGQDYFEKIMFELLAGRTPLDEISISLPGNKLPAPVRPQRLEGRLKFDNDSAVARCYRAYVRMFAERL